MSNILPGASAQLRRQVLRELARLSAQLTAAKVQMPFFCREQVLRPRTGRPLNEPVAGFAAILFSRLSGNSRKRAIEILTADPSRASGAVWSVASKAHADGCKTSEDFLRWLQGEESKEPSPL